jgi:hypothetical protein
MARPTVILLIPPLHFPPSYINVFAKEAKGHKTTVPSLRMFVALSLHLDARGYAEVGRG